MVRRLLLAAVTVLTLSGGGCAATPAPAPTAAVAPAAQAVAASVHVAAVLRNSGSGWIVLSNSAHAPEHIVPGAAGVTDMGGYLRIHFDQTFAKVGAIAVSPDEAFAPLYTAGASVGLSYFNLYMFNAAGAPVAPGTVVAPSGNWWVTGTMWV